MQQYRQVRLITGHNPVIVPSTPRLAAFGRTARAKNLIWVNLRNEVYNLYDLGFDLGTGRDYASSLIGRKQMVKPLQKRFVVYRSLRRLGIYHCFLVETWYDSVIAANCVGEMFQTKMVKFSFFFFLIMGGEQLRSSRRVTESSIFR